MITKELLNEANKDIKTVPIKGKNYVMVNDRVQRFRDICPSGCIETEIIELANGICTIRAVVRDDDGKILATGIAQEKESNGYINKTSYIENCETSAIGRALGFVGIGIDDSLGSAQEVANAMMNQDDNEPPKRSRARQTRAKQSDPIIEEAEATPVSEQDVKKMRDMAEMAGKDVGAMMEYFRVSDLSEMNKAQCGQACALLQQAIDKKNGKQKGIEI